MTNILKDKTNRVLLLMSFPIGLGMLSTFLFQVIDTYFIGQLGPDALAALSFSSTIYFILVSLYIGLSIGVSVIVGKSVGEGNREKVKKTTRVSLLLSILLSTSLSFLTMLIIEPLFSALGASGEIIPLIEEYTIPILIGMPFLTVAITSGAILRASGNITKPEVIMGIAGAINLAFDYALIFGKWGLPEIGIQGAAYATLISWAFAMVAMIELLLKDQLLRITDKATDSLSGIVKEIFSLGAPTILTQIVGPVTITFLTYILAKQSALAVAAFGVVSRMEMLLLIGILAISNSITPFVAQNSGAKAEDRVDEAIIFGGKSATYLGLLVAVLLFLFVQPMARIFSDDPVVIEYITQYFYIVSLSYIFYALFLITTAIFNGMQKTMTSLKITLIKSFVFTAPLALLGSFWGVQGVFVAMAVTNVLAGLYAGIPMKKEMKQHRAALYKVSAVEDYKNDIKRLFGRGKSL